ncbi:MAG: hypothetical protein ACLPKE_25830, partial [Streptosporangiaceae bacterium]
SEGQGKAELATLLGRDEGMRDERRHASRTLPRGVCRELRQAVLGREFGAAQRASAICVGLPPPASATSCAAAGRRARPLAPRTRFRPDDGAARGERRFGKDP